MHIFLKNHSEKKKLLEINNMTGETKKSREGLEDKVKKGEILRELQLQPHVENRYAHLAPL